jgi:DNA-binding GntR family transcriptional regulator
LIETRIAEQMRTSRGPVRDAIALLEREGLVAKTPHRGASVPVFDPKLLWETASLRGKLEEFAVALAIPRLTPDDLTRLESLALGMEDAAARRAVEHFNGLDYQFHDVIIRMSDHRTLHEVWRSMQRRFRVFLASTNVINDDLRVVSRRHRAILLALASRKPAQGLRAIQDHFSLMEKELNQLLGVPAAPGHRREGRRTHAGSREFG